jgi:membrane dipeptidase
VKLIDLHEDLAFSSQNMNVISESNQSSIEQLGKIGDSIVFGVVYPHVFGWKYHINKEGRKPMMLERTTYPSFRTAVDQVKFYDEISRSLKIPLIKGSGDLVLKKLKLLISLEGTDVLNEPSDAYILKDLGVRCLGLTWNYDTKFAASCMSKKDYGLTGSGEELIEICNDIGLIVDVAHSSKNTIIEACKISRKPVICSHGNSKKIMKHARNLDDVSIDAISSTGGIIGMTAIPATLSHDPKISDLKAHAEYIGNSFGWDHVGIGTDFLGLLDEKTPRGFENINKISDLAELLESHAEDVLWKNSLRVLKRAII